MQFFQYIKSVLQPRIKVKILLMRHGTGTHITGDYDEVKSKAIGPSLTGQFSSMKKMNDSTESGKKKMGGIGEAYRRTVRQLNEKSLSPNLILISPQLRAIETAAYARLNEKSLKNGKKLRDVPIKIMRNCYEQTRCLSGQGAIIPSIKNAKNKWPHWNVIKKDKGLSKEIDLKIKNKPRQPPRDPKGSALPRATLILQRLLSNEKYDGKVVLIIAHNGICQDIIRAYNPKKRNVEVFDFCEIRDLDDYGEK